MVRCNSRSLNGNRQHKNNFPEKLFMLIICCPPKRVEPFNWEIAMGGGGGKTYRAILEALQNSFWRAQKPGLVWSVPVPSKWQGVNGGGGESYHRWGGPEPFLGGGFMVWFPLPWVFHPLCFLWSEVISTHCLERLFEEEHCHGDFVDHSTRRENQLSWTLLWAFSCTLSWRI